MKHPYFDPVRNIQITKNKNETTSSDNEMN